MLRLNNKGNIAADCLFDLYVTKVK